MPYRATSASWNALMIAEENFRKHIGEYNNNTSFEEQVKDVLASFNDRIGMLITTRLMSEGYFKTELIERVWKELVEIVLLGNFSASHWAINALKRIPVDRRVKYKEELIMLVFTSAKKETLAKDPDDISIKFGYQLLQELNYEEVAVYEKKYYHYLDLE